MPDAPVDRLEVGRVVRAHGLRGEVVVAPITNRDERFAVGTTLDVNGEPRVIASSRRHQARWLVQFDGITDRDGAERLRGATLTAPPLDDYADDEMWVHELIGATVYDRAGTVLGEVVAIEANPAHDLLVLDSGPLIPMVFVDAHDDARIVVDLPDGLLDL